MRILVTRPEIEAASTRIALEEMGYEVLVAPMLTIRPNNVPLPSGPYNAVVVTSGNAVAALVDQPARAALLDLPLAAVGRRTAEAAHAAGFAKVETPGRDMTALAEHIAKSWPKGRRILYLAGTDRTGDLAALLAIFGHRTDTAIVYEARKATAFPAAVAIALRQEGIDAVLHYSARTAEAFIDCAAGVIDLAAGRLRHLCLSERVAACLRAAGATQIAVAEQPEEVALFRLIDG